MTDEIRRLLERLPRFWHANAGMMPEAPQHPDNAAIEKWVRWTDIEALLSPAAPPPESECEEALISSQMRVAALNEELVKANLKVEAFRDIAERAAKCHTFRPDHNGECLNCDEWADAHTPDAIERGRLLAQIAPLTDQQVDAFLTELGEQPDDPERRARIRAIFDQKRGT